MLSKWKFFSLWNNGLQNIPTDCRKSCYERAFRENTKLRIVTMGSFFMCVLLYAIMEEWTISLFGNLYGFGPSLSWFLLVATVGSIASPFYIKIILFPALRSAYRSLADEERVPWGKRHCANRMIINFFGELFTFIGALVVATVMPFENELSPYLGGVILGVLMVYFHTGYKKWRERLDRAA